MRRGLVALLLLGSVVNAAAMTSDEQCLATALYFEARGESLQGQQAIASVIFNRVADERFPATVCAVVKDGGEVPPCQFSWWCDGQSDRPRDTDSFAVITERARRWVRKRPRDNSRGALFFHASRQPVPWRRPRQRTAAVGAHIFYR
ncbi:MAG: cell wall hydrolase [Pseudomonadota bacterium]